jgi:hypothetical protein
MDVRASPTLKLEASFGAGKRRYADFSHFGGKNRLHALFLQGYEAEKKSCINLPNLPKLIHAIS